MNEPTDLTPPSVAIEAKRWAVPLDDLTPIEQKRLKRWLEASDEHREAFEAAKREWQSLAFLQELRNEPSTKAQLRLAADCSREHRDDDARGRVVAAVAIGL